MAAVPPLNYLTLFVPNLSACVHFYRDLLGLTVEQESERFVLLSAGNCRIGLHASDQPVDARAVNLHFRVDDVDRISSELVERGAECAHAPRDRPWGVRAADFTDPAGFQVEIIGPIRK